MEAQKGNALDMGGENTDSPDIKTHECAVVEVHGKFQMSEKRILKNLVVVSIAFLLLFTAFQSLQNLQSSLNKEEGLGTISLSVIYAVGIIAGIFLPPLAINILGCKWTMAASIICYTVFIAANLYAVWATMIPASIIIGTGAATLWAAKCTYLTNIGSWYAEKTNSSKEGTISAFFGVFFMIFQSSQIWGNLISSTVFSQRIPDNLNISAEVLAKCGASYCPSDYINNTYLDKPAMSKVYTVCGIYLGTACLAILTIAIFLDNIRHETDGREMSTKQLLGAIARHFYNSKYQKLLIPLTVYSGIEQAFIAGDYTRSYISCTIGVWNVGYVMITYGVADAACSLIIGRLVKYFGFLPWFILAFILHGGTIITLLVWQPDPEHPGIFYLFAILWGIGDAVIQTLVNALYGHLFTHNPESAFASYRLCESAGFIIAFGYSSYICTYIKIYISLIFIIVGAVLYGVVEMLQRKQKRTVIGSTS
ncbi:protein unc-93 homolog A-like [Ruditapes philippinarum]|uniref:protein unc-93 homolog A-like n=1 Tax=Ruditapes philippinarum TaxID=129788 RepID=UPI00295B3004|nr:protein unc-93 homolog A-like [Ruditapes philippinarum]